MYLTMLFNEQTFTCLLFYLISIFFPKNIIFLQFEEARDAEDAIRGRDGYDFDGHRLRVGHHCYQVIRKEEAMMERWIQGSTE